MNVNYNTLSEFVLKIVTSATQRFSSAPWWRARDKIDDDVYHDDLWCIFFLIVFDGMCQKLNVCVDLAAKIDVIHSKRRFLNVD